MTSAEDRAFDLLLLRPDGVPRSSAEGDQRKRLLGPWHGEVGGHRHSIRLPTRGADGVPAPSDPSWSVRSGMTVGLAHGFLSAYTRPKFRLRG